jgi:glutamine synthetase
LPAGHGAPHALPRSLGEALKAMEASDAVRGWFGPVFLEAYLRHKRSELAYTEDFAVTELCHRYGEIY